MAATSRKRDVRTNWGYTDKALAVRAVQALDQTPEPFAALVLTVSNHHPFQVPADATSRAPVEGEEQRGFFRPGPGYPSVGRHTVPMMKTIHYTDEAVGDFFRLVATKEWAKRTIFVISGDHGLPIVPVGGLASQHELDELRHRVPLIFWSPLLGGGHVVSGPASLADVPPTLLGLMGLDGASGFVGADFLDPAVDLRSRPLPLWDEEARRVTVLKDGFAFHATVDPPRSAADWHLGEELLFDTARDPRGTNDLSGSLPARAKEMRELTSTYMDVYPWLALAGRTGIPRELRPFSEARRQHVSPRPVTVNVSDFDFDLPPESIAQRPAPRGTSRLMTLDRATGAVDAPERRGPPVAPPIRGTSSSSTTRGSSPPASSGATPTDAAPSSSSSRRRRTPRRGTASRSRGAGRSRDGRSTSGRVSRAPSPGRANRGTTASPSRGRRSRRRSRSSERRRSPRTSTARGASPTRATPRTTRPSTRGSRERSPPRRPAFT